MKTNFQKVFEFNQISGVPVSTKLRTNIFKNDPSLVELRLNLIREEVAELEDACKDGDIIETIDAIADILYVVYGMAVSLTGR